MKTTMTKTQAKQALTDADASIERILAELRTMPQTKRMMPRRRELQRQYGVYGERARQALDVLCDLA